MEEYITFINWVLYLFIECKDSIDLNEKTMEEHNTIYE